MNRSIGLLIAFDNARINKDHALVREYLVLLDFILTQTAEVLKGTLDV